jgi:RNA polymerase sigma factor (TIGR02999 family)
MRRILVENGRWKRSEKRGGGRLRVDLSDVSPPMSNPDHDLVALNEALEELEKINRTKAQVVKLRYSAGLTVRQAAEAMGILASTADNYWAYARAWLRVELRPDDAIRNE